MRPRRTTWLWVHALLFSPFDAPANGQELAGNYSAWMAASIMSRQQGILGGPGDASQLLQAGFTQKAFHQLLSSNLSASAAIADSLSAYIQDSVASVTNVVSNASQDTSYPLDRLSSGNALLRAYAQTENASYASALTALEDSIALQPRNAEGGLWYYVYPNVSYLDGMYSFAPFSAAYALAYDDEPVSLRHAVANITYQLDLLWEHCRNASTGLLVHGYDAAKTRVWANPVTGASPHVWGRSLGWYSLALVDTLELLQSALLDGGVDVGAWHHVRGRFQELAGAIARAADPASGAWWQVLDEPGREGNYIESSGSAMFVAALLKGSRLGYLNTLDLVDADATAGNISYTDVASRAYEYIVETFVVDNGSGTLGWNGTVSVCSLNSTASYEVCRPSSDAHSMLINVTRSTMSANRSCMTACLGLLLSCSRRWSTNCSRIITDT